MASATSASVASPTSSPTAVRSGGQPCAVYQCARGPKKVGALTVPKLKATRAVYLTRTLATLQHLNHRVSPAQFHLDTQV